MKSFKQYLGEDLRQWFKQKWVRMDTKGNIKGDCAREPGEGKPKCLPQAKAHAIGKEARASAAQRKRREDPNPERRGAPINVKTEETIFEKWSQKYKKSIDCNNPKGFSQKAHCQGRDKNEEVDEACWDGYTAKGMKKKGNRMVPNCVPEEVESIDEKNVPTSPEKWARAKAAAKSKFAVYPSAYANGWASKKYKAMGGGWRTEETVSEDGVGAIGGSAGPTNVTGVATSTDPISATAVNRKKKITPILLSIRRKPPQG
jgi:hypothetical protein